MDGALTNVQAAGINGRTTSTNVRGACINVQKPSSNVDAAAINVRATNTNVPEARINVQMPSRNGDGASGAVKTTTYRAGMAGTMGDGVRRLRFSLNLGLITPAPPVFEKVSWFLKLMLLLLPHRLTDFIILLITAAETAFPRRHRGDFMGFHENQTINK